MSQNTRLKKLECYTNQLTTLDASHNPAQEWIHYGLTWAEIAGKAHYYERSCRRIHDVALKNMDSSKR